MATKKPETPNENMAVLEMGTWGCTLIMPVTHACEIVKLLEHAKRYDSVYKDNATKVHIGGDLPKFTLTLVSGDSYIEGLINGPKPKE